MGELGRDREKEEEQFIDKTVWEEAVEAGVSRGRAERELRELVRGGGGGDGCGGEWSAFSPVVRHFAKTCNK